MFELAPLLFFLRQQRHSWNGNVHVQSDKSGVSIVIEHQGTHPPLVEKHITWEQIEEWSTRLK